MVLPVAPPAVRVQALKEILLGEVPRLLLVQDLEDFFGERGAVQGKGHEESCVRKAWDTLEERAELRVLPKPRLGLILVVLTALCVVVLNRTGATHHTDSLLP